MKSVVKYYAGFTRGLGTYNDQQFSDKELSHATTHTMTRTYRFQNGDRGQRVQEPLSGKKKAIILNFVSKPNKLNIVWSTEGWKFRLKII